MISQHSPGTGRLTSPEREGGPPTMSSVPSRWKSDLSAPARPSPKPFVALIVVLVLGVGLGAGCSSDKKSSSSSSSGSSASSGTSPADKTLQEGLAAQNAG